MLPCFKCGRRLHSAIPGGIEDEGTTNQPYAGTAFTTGGHYGSTFFDPIDWQRLEITICDACLANNRAAIGWFQHSRPVTCGGLLVGIEIVADGHLQPYTGQDEDGEEINQMRVTPTDLGHPWRRVRWDTSVFEAARRAFEADEQAGV